MTLIYKLFKLDSNSREGAISATSILNIVVNLFIALLKIVFGVIASSIAIISEGVNNATDALSSVLTLIGTRLANKKRDAKHPFGYGRIEYLTSLIISIFILVSGFEVLMDSIKRVISPEDLNISYYSLIVVAISAIIKFVLGNFTISKGKKVGSETLQDVGEDCRNDSYVSLVTIATALIFLFTKINIDAYAGIFTSIIILKTGYEILSRTTSELLGEPADHELVSNLYREIRNTDGVINAVDMVLHNYGPDTYSGSCNVEMDHNKTVGEIYDIIHALQIKIAKEYLITMVFGIYAVDKDSNESKKLHEQIANYVKKQEHIKSYHAIYFDKKADSIYCDLVVDYETNDFDNINKEFVKYMNELYPNKNIIVNIDTEFV